MREDTQLVITEAPGLNISNKANKEGRAYFENHWDELDAVVLVMDARQSVDYDDQMENLELIYRLSSTKKAIPCFILCNKVSILVLWIHFVIPISAA